MCTGQSSTDGPYQCCQKNKIRVRHIPFETLARLEELKIEYVPKEENPPNVPQIRSIDNFCAILKNKVSRSNYSPNDLKCLMAVEQKYILKKTAKTTIALWAKRCQYAAIRRKL
jgi:hypothetical protein